MYARFNIGDQPGINREIGHKPIRGLCQRLKGEISSVIIGFFETSRLNTPGQKQHLPNRQTGSVSW